MTSMMLMLLMDKKKRKKINGRCKFKAAGTRPAPANRTESTTPKGHTLPLLYSLHNNNKTSYIWPDFII